MSETAETIAVLKAAGYHVERQGTYDNRMKRIAVLENQLRWAEEEKEHHEKWLAGILDESGRLRDRFNRITAALASSGVEWSVIADLIGDDTRVTSPDVTAARPTFVDERRAEG